MMNHRAALLMRFSSASTCWYWLLLSSGSAADFPRYEINNMLYMERLNS